MYIYFLSFEKCVWKWQEVGGHFVSASMCWPHSKLWNLECDCKDISFICITELMLPLPMAQLSLLVVLFYFSLVSHTPYEPVLSEKRILLWIVDLLSKTLRVSVSVLCLHIFFLYFLNKNFLNFNYSSISCNLLKIATFVIWDGIFLDIWCAKIFMLVFINFLI